MIKVKIQKIAQKFNIKNAYQLQNFTGFAPSKAAYVWRGEWQRADLETLNTLCNVFKCTPNDLLEWQPDASQNVSETHSMNSLKKTPERDLPKLLSEIPADKLEQILDVLQDLKAKPN